MDDKQAPADEIKKRSIDVEFDPEIDREIESANAARRLNHIIGILHSKKISWFVKTSQIPTWTFRPEVEVGGFSVPFDGSDDEPLSVQKLADALFKGYEFLMSHPKSYRWNMD
ncbi:MAG: hypothetical protein MUF38_14830 [Anaerolineae bacterium]|jgi:hypothetical protein|nr:hypothetical protein [Anaerolineae bacterium]